MLTNKERGFFKALFSTLFIAVSVLLFSACTAKKDSSLAMVEYQLPISIKQNLSYSKAYIYNGAFYGFNRNHLGLDKISIDSNLQRPAKLAISFEQEGPHAVSAPWHITADNEKIYLWDGQKNLTVLGSDFQIEQRQHFDFEQNGNILGFGNGYTVNPPNAVSSYEGQIILPLYKLIPRTSEGYYDSLYFAEIDMKTFDFQIKAFSLPVEFKENYWPIHDEYYVQKVADKDYIITFKAMAAVLAFKEDQLFKRHEIDLREYNLNKAVGTLPKSYDQIAAYRNMAYARGSQQFLPLRYDAEEGVFYRIIKGDTDGSSPVPNKNLHLFKYDRNFKLLNYSKLPDGLLGDFILNSGKLYFQHSELTAENEEVFRLSVINGF
jgi:hypothetical protein